ncbi:MAG: choice-of-anchor J domain-containing protein [Ferruginibacter sp.]
MRKNSFNFFTVLGLAILSPVLFITSCQKDAVAPKAKAATPAAAPLSFTEDFNDVSGLTGKGWVFKNNSNPIGQSGWRVGRYEANPQPNKKFNASTIGFPAYNAVNSPNDFVSCDVTCVNTAGDISAWLITPPMTIKNGDVLTFYTRSQDDFTVPWPIYTKDRMQVRGNFTDGSSNIGTTATSLGSFTNLLLDMNPSYIENDNGGYPVLDWAKETVTFSGITGTVTNARVAFRYLGTDAGLTGGTSAANFASIIGIDNVVFTSK